MFWTAFWFIIGVIIMVKGGDYFVDAASWMAEVSGIPKFIVGATVVSFATTLPEIIVSSIAAHEGHVASLMGNLVEAEGKVGMSIGNAVGSVTANIGLIMAIGILFMPAFTSRKQFMPKAILLLLAVTSLMFLGLRGDGLTVVESIVLLIIFAVFIGENLVSAKKELADGEDVGGIEEKDIPSKDGKTIATNVAKFLVGAAGIVFGSILLVNKGTDIATYFGVSQKIIGFTAIAIGTSLPELVTTITAIIKKESSLSVGNVIGANIIDTALILPVCAMLYGGKLPVVKEEFIMDIVFCLTVAVIAVVPTLITQKLHRWQGVLLLTVYGGYLASMFMNIDLYSWITRAF